MKTRWYRGKLYWQNIDDPNERGLIGDFAVQAKSRIAATELILDGMWDDRLDSASCSPLFAWEQEEQPRVLAEVSVDQALKIAATLGEILRDGNPAITPAVYHDAVQRVERQFGIGAVVLTALWVVPMRQSLDSLVSKPKSLGEALASGQTVTLTPVLVGVGKPCSICEEVIQADEASVADGEDFAHLSCICERDDGDDIDREHGAS